MQRDLENPATFKGNALKHCHRTRLQENPRFCLIFLQSPNCCWLCNRD